MKFTQPNKLVVDKLPIKTTCFVGDTLDITGLELIATYSNSDTETVTNGYTVSGFSSSTAGTNTVTVAYNGKTTTFNIEVVEPSITLSSNSLSFDNIGSSKTLTATTAPSDQNITWTSSNTSVATVSDDGVVTVKGDGNATITAKFTYNNIEYTAICDVTVKVPVVLTSVSVSKMPAKITYFVGDTLDVTSLELIAAYSNGDTETVTNGYTVSGFDSETAGTKTVTVTYKEKDATFEVEVVEPSITLSNNSLSFDNIGNSKTLTATTAPSDQNITWTSSNTSVATVSDDGVVTAKGDGNATITAKFTYNNIDYTAICNVTVKVPIVLTSVSVSKMPAKTTYFVGDTLDITGLELIATYSNGDTEKVTNGYTVSGFDSSTAGTKTVTVDYKGKTATFTVEVVKPTVSFPDVANEAWYYNAVKFNVDKGYFHGYANGYFGPGNNIQRQDFVVVLSKIAGADLSAYAGQNGGFSDVPKNDYYSAAVAWAKDNHILSGYVNGKFGVGDPITREQACLIFYNYCSGEVSGDVNTVLAGYPDGGNVSDWARTAVAWAAENRVVGGNGKLNPAGNANRAEMAQIIMNMSSNNIL